MKKMLKKIFKLSNKGQREIIGLMIFEFKSWVGRNFLKKRSRIVVNSNPFLLDLGAGENFSDGWTHANFFSFSNKRKSQIELDLRYPINCRDNVVDGIYCGHTLEHFYPLEAEFLLSEIYRILKPKCWLRINVPDIKKYIDFYTGKDIAPEFSNFKSGCEALMNISQNFGHHSIWDETCLSNALEKAGFQNVAKVDFGIEGTDERLIKEEEVRRFETLVLEAQKPFA